MYLFQEEFVFPTIGKEELNLSIGPMALSVDEVGEFTRKYGTYIGDLKVQFNTSIIIIFLSNSNHPTSRNS